MLNINRSAQGPSMQRRSFQTKLANSLNCYMRIKPWPFYTVYRKSLIKQLFMRMTSYLTESLVSCFLWIYDSKPPRWDVYSPQSILPNVFGFNLFADWQVNWELNSDMYYLVPDRHTYLLRVYIRNDVLHNFMLISGLKPINWFLRASYLSEDLFIR